MPAIVVFLGPSLDRETAREHCGADYRPPAARGDILQAARDGARIIGLIDGVFFQECSVGHREVLAVLEAGVRVIGSSSMGALRAAELDTLGMEGVGDVYRLYHDGEIESDDEVALVFDPVYFIPASEPLVNIRCTIRRALEAGLIGQSCADTLLARAQDLYFPGRTYDAIIAGAAGEVDDGELSCFRQFAETSACDLKREDALLALDRIRELAGELGISGPSG
jgi:hypothetical protein